MYTIVAVPYGYKSRNALVDTIVRDTLTGRAPETEHTYAQKLQTVTKPEPGRQRLTNQLDAKPDGYEERFIVERDQKNRSFRAVGTDAEGRYVLEHCEEYGPGGAVSSACAYYVLTDLEYGRYARMALVNGQIGEEEYDRLTAEAKTAQKRKDPFFRLLAGYPDLVVEYSIVRCKAAYSGYESHRRALTAAFRELGAGWQGEPERAEGKSISVAKLFSPAAEGRNLNYRKAFLDPPHKNSYTARDFDRLNAALFPNGTEGLEPYEWTTDWSEYFDDGHEWWGALCLTVYDPSLDRFAVIMASATD